TSGLHIFRHILPKSSLIHKVLPAVLASSDEKSGCAIRTRGDTEQALRIKSQQPAAMVRFFLYRQKYPKIP
ncbi:MAG: hypothetical protein II828_06230, partial [Clostridia bacterium]|nr:hypothetical protein [Clostridia bacterium]